MQLRSTRLTAISSAVKKLFNPISLFSAGEQGAWYDPSDFSTMFQDSAGTTPVTAVEQPVGLMLDKSKGLMLGPELSAYASGFSSTTGITGIGATVALSGASLVTTAISTDGVDRAEIPISGLTTGQRYLVTIVARRGAQGTNQSIRTSTALNIPNSLLASTSNQTFTFRVDAIAASGVIRVYAADATGAVGDSIIVDSISVRELPGNHAFQSTAASRPVLSARVNLLTKTEQFDDVVWTKINTSVTQNVVIAPDGTLTGDKLVENTAATAAHEVSASISFTSGTTYVVSVYARAAERSIVRLGLPSNAFGAGVAAYFNLSTGVVGTIQAGAPTAAIESVGNGWYRCSISKAATTSAAGSTTILQTTTDNVLTYTGDGTSGIYIWGADLRVTNTGTNLPEYQRVNTATDYDTTGFPLYLAFDGVDDWMQTNSIDFTGTDKISVVAGVRKLSDAAGGILVELSTTASNPGMFYLTAPENINTLGNYGAFSRGSVSPGVAGLAKSAIILAPVTSVVSCSYDISGDLTSIRVNGSSSGTNGTGDQGTGNYGNYQLYIGRRGGTTLPFNGRFYGLIVRGAQSTAQQITAAENWINSKTKAY